MSVKNKVEVVIGGEIITLVSNENEEYMQRIARYVDRKLNEIKSLKSSASINEKTKSKFIAINIADDYFKTVEKMRRLEDEHLKFVTELGRMQEENYLLTERIHEIQDSLNNARAELSALTGTPAEQIENKNIVNLSKRTTGSRR